MLYDVGLNKVEFIGRVGRDPTFREDHERTMVRFSLATSENYTNNAGMYIVSVSNLYHCTTIARQLGNSISIYIYIYR